MSKSTKKVTIMNLSKEIAELVERMMSFGLSRHAAEAHVAKHGSE